MSSDIIKGLDLYLNNYQDYVLKYSVIESIKKDLIQIKGKMNTLETIQFLKDSYYNRTGLCSIGDIIVFGNSVYNPMLNNRYLDASLFIKYQEKNIYQNTGIDFITFRNLSKEDQNLLLDTMQNVILNKTQTVSDVVRELEESEEQ